MKFLRPGNNEPRNLWEHPADEPPTSGSGYCVGQMFDARQVVEIVHAVNERRSIHWLASRLHGVHMPDSVDSDAAMCTGCHTVWPCPTVDIIGEYVGSEAIEHVSNEVAGRNSATAGDE